MILYSDPWNLGGIKTERFSFQLQVYIQGAFIRSSSVLGVTVTYLEIFFSNRTIIVFLEADFFSNRHPSPQIYYFSTLRYIQQLRVTIIQITLYNYNWFLQETYILFAKYFKRKFVSFIFGLVFSTYNLVSGQKHPKFIHVGWFSGNGSRI